MSRFLIFSVVVGVFLTGCNHADPESFDPTQSSYFTEADAIMDIDGQTIRYRETGPEDAPVIVLLHGFSDSLHSWDRLAAELDQDFRIIRPDLPGHGLSGQPPDDDYTNEALTSFVGAFLDAKTAEGVTLVGNSLGGLAAWRYAAQPSDRLQGLVLLAPGGVPHNGVTEEPLPVPAMLRFYLKNAPEAGVRAALQAMHIDESLVTDDFVTQFRDMMKVPGNGAGFVARAGSFTLPDPKGDMTRIDVPTLLIWGAEDTVLPASHAEIFSDNIAQIETIILENVGHMPQSEATDDVASMIRAFVMQTQMIEAGDGS